MKYLRRSWFSGTIRKINGPDIVEEDFSDANLSYGQFTNRSQLIGLIAVIMLGTIVGIVDQRFIGFSGLFTYAIQSVFFSILISVRNLVTKAPRSLLFLVIWAGSTMYALGYVVGWVGHLPIFKHSTFVFRYAALIPAMYLSVYIERFPVKFCSSYRDRLTIRDSTFEQSNILDSRWLDVTVKGCKFNGAFLEMALISEATVESCSFTSADMNKIKIYWTRCTGTSFENASITSASFASSTFTSCRFDNSNLRATDFGQCKFEKTSFRKADLAGANLSKATFNDVDFTGATATAYTKWPDSFSPAQKGISFSDHPPMPKTSLAKDPA